MKKGAVNSVIVLSLLCMVGVLVLQSIWVSHTYSIGQNYFNSSVIEAMNNAIEAYDKTVVFTEFHSQFFDDSLGGESEVRIMVSKFDTSEEVNLKMDSINGVNMHPDTFRRLINREMGIDSLKFAARSRHNKLIGRDTFNLQLKNRVENIVGKIVDDISTDNLLFRFHLKPEGMDSLLTYAMQQKGIYGGYDFAIRGPGGDIYYKTANFNMADTAGAYGALMYPLNIIHHPETLLVQVHHKTHHIVHSVLPVFIGALVFTLFIIITFWLTIRLILKQKKISTIKNDFINNMTHEFKTPIATIAIAADAMKSGGLSAEQVNHFAGIIKQESQNMNQKVETILQMALLEQQKVKLALKITDTHKLLENARQHLALQLEKSRAAFTTQYGATHTKILADDLHLTNVFANVIDNAIKYTNGVPHITVTTANTVDSIVITIADKGVGMTKEEQKHVFDKFYRAQSGNVHNTKGFGLGLSYAFEVVTLHKGTIRLESEKNVGTTFIITLPLINE